MHEILKKQRIGITVVKTAVIQLGNMKGFSKEVFSD